MTNPIEIDCQGCGAPLRFAPGTDTLVCDHCGRRQEIDAPAEDRLAIREHDFLGAVESMAATSAVRGFLGTGVEVRCPDCGTHAELQGQAGRCPYCDSPLVVSTEREQGRLLPESVLPFVIDRQESLEIFRKWASSRWFAPNDLATRAREAKIDGVYMPFFTYDSLTLSEYRGQRGTYYYTTEWYTDSQGKRRSRRKRKTRWRPCSGAVRVEFDDVLVCASTSLPRELVDRLEPWDLDALKPYDPAYLTGFIAEHYSIELEAGLQLAEQQMEPRIRRVVEKDIGGDTQRIDTLSVEHQDTTYKHCLLPLWISSYRYDDEIYRFLINARTGEPIGDYPMSKGKILLVIAVVALIVLFAIYAR